MNVTFHRKFAKDLTKIGSSDSRDRIKQVILNLEAAESLESFPHIKAMKGAGGYLRIRIGDYRLGLKREDDDSGGILLLRVMHRSEIYRYFPPE
jgi:mRNA interferase RelE/StbE